MANISRSPSHRSTHLIRYFEATMIEKNLIFWPDRQFNAVGQNRALFSNEPCRKANGKKWKKEKELKKYIRKKGKNRRNRNRIKKRMMK